MVIIWTNNDHTHTHPDAPAFVRLDHRGGFPEEHGASEANTLAQRIQHKSQVLWGLCYLYQDGKTYSL